MGQNTSDDEAAERLERKMKGDTPRTVVQNRIAQMSVEYATRAREERIEEERQWRISQAQLRVEVLAPSLGTAQDETDDGPGEAAADDDSVDLPE